MTGAPTAEIKVYGEGEVTLFAKLYDAASGQLAVLPGGLAAPLRVSATPTGTPVKVTLPAIDRRIEPGHVLRLAVTTTDMAYALPSQPSVHTGGAGLDHADDAGRRRSGRPGHRARPGGRGRSRWPRSSRRAVILLTGRGRAGAAIAPDPALAEVPLEITGLTKHYKNGHKAVDDLSFRVEKGQVLGLLGPNGAGKTTTMRMMMGLIHPDEGEIRIFGDTVVPGAPVLSRLGSFVEGPGFLPHLTGRDNLRLYWQATGRPAADAHIRGGAGDRRSRRGRGAAAPAPTRRACGSAWPSPRPCWACPTCSCSTSPPTGSTRPRSPRCGEVLRALRHRGPDRHRLQPPARRGRADLQPRRRHAPGPPGLGRARSAELLKPRRAQRRQPAWRTCSST